MKVTKISVTVSKTLQVERFEPVTVTLTADSEVNVNRGTDLDEEYEILYKAVSKQAKRFIQNELTKHLAEVETNEKTRKQKGVSR